MAICPNCHGTVSISAKSCALCGAIFAANGWKPIPDRTDTPDSHVPSEAADGETSHAFAHYVQLSTEDLKGLLGTNVLMEDHRQFVLDVLQRRGIATEYSGGFFTKLSRGNYGLAETYWLYGVLVGVIVNIVFSILKSPGIIALAFLGYIAYEIPVIMGIWRSATKYTGPRIWAVLAKAVCVLSALMLAAGLFAIVGLLKNA